MEELLIKSALQISINKLWTKDEDQDKDEDKTRTRRYRKGNIMYDMYFCPKKILSGELRYMRMSRKRRRRRWRR